MFRKVLMCPNHRVGIWDYVIQPLLIDSSNVPTTAFHVIFVLQHEEPD